MTENLDILKVQVNEHLPQRGGGSKPEYQEKNSDRQSEPRYDIIEAKTTEATP